MRMGYTEGIMRDGAKVKQMEKVGIPCSCCACV